MKLLIITLALGLSFHSLTFAKTAKCAKYKKALETIQSKQRQANTVKKSNSLKKKELKAFKDWRRCKQGKLK
ncbi:hypothetical protein [Colwellia sp. MEBiC06753]